MPTTWSIQTAPLPGAVATIQLVAGTTQELDVALARLGISPVRVGQVALRNLCGVDRGLVARWNELSAHLMPHGGIAVIRAIIAALDAAQIYEQSAQAPAAVYPEARSPLEARMLETLSRAASPLAVDLLLDQPRRWNGLDPEAPPPITHDDRSRHRALSHLISPPLVVAIGPPNIGKSSLLNALAGRNAAIVADEPGTTRDHIGVHIDMAGLVVRYIDTPGIRDSNDPIESEARHIAQDLIAGADLILSCGDATAPPIPRHDAHATLTVATRADLGSPPWPHDVSVSTMSGAGLPALVALIRERLVPAAALADPHPWRFWA